MGTLLILLVLLPAAEPAADAQLTAQVRALVAKLDASTLAAREQAQQELTALGDRVLPLLPQDLARLSLEQRTRVEAVRLAVEAAGARSLAAGSRVTLAGKDLPLAQVFAAIEKQTGNKLVDKREKSGEKTADKTINVDFRDTPFWQAIDEVLGKSELGVYGYSGEPGLAIVSRPGEGAKQGQVDYRGAFRFEPLRLEARRNLRNPASDGLRVILEIGWEPKAVPISLIQDVSDLSALDENGQALAIDTQQKQLEAMVQPGSTAVEFELPLVAPPRSVQKIAKLRGRLQVVLPGPSGVFRFDKLASAENVQQQQGRATVVLERMKDLGDGAWQAMTRVRFEDPGKALESHRGWIYNNPAYLIGPDGQRVEGGFETTGQTENEVGAAYLFFTGGSLEGYTFVYETPTAVVAEQVDYELSDLPLP